MIYRHILLFAVLFDGQKHVEAPVSNNGVINLVRVPQTWKKMLAELLLGYHKTD